MKVGVLSRFLIAFLTWTIDVTIGVLVVHPRLSSSNPNFSKLRNRTADSDFLSRLTHQLLGRLKSTVANLQIYLPRKANSEKLGLGIDNPHRIVFLSLRTNKCLEGVNGRHFWNPGVFSYAMIPRCRPNSTFFFIVASIVYGF
jgi:integral membrane sensor domain MASE1